MKNFISFASIRHIIATVIFLLLVVVIFGILKYVTRSNIDINLIVITLAVIYPTILRMQDEIKDLQEEVEKLKNKLKELEK